MTRLAAVALLVIGLAGPAWAQRGGGHAGGGFGGHSAGAFHSGGFAAPHFSQGFTGSRSYGFGNDPRYARPFTGYRYPGSGFRPAYPGYGYNRLGRRGYWAPYSYYGYSSLLYYPDWIGLGPLGCYPDVSVYNDDDGPDCGDQQVNAGQPAFQEYNEDGAPGSEIPPPPADEPPAYEPPATTRPSEIPTNEVATTIVFKDGRASEQIHNYALTQTTLYVLDENHRDIPLDQLDLAATESVNRAAGIEFQVPQTVQ